MNISKIECKNAKKTLVFIHGWCCKPSNFSHQVDFFKSQHNIILVDYASETPPQNPYPNLFENTVLKIKNLIFEASLDKLVFIGHSLGGNIALSLTNQLQNLVESTVIIDTSLPRAEGTAEKFAPLLSKIQNLDGQSVLQDFIKTHMINAKLDHPIVSKCMINEMIACWKKAPKLFSKLLGDTVDFDSGKAITNCTRPLLYACGEPPSGDIAALRKLNPSIFIAPFQSGHFIMGNQANELNQVLEKFFNPF